MSMKIDRIQDDKILWNKMYENKNTDQYQVLEGEVNYAVIYKYSLYFQLNFFFFSRLGPRWLLRPFQTFTWGTV